MKKFVLFFIMFLFFGFVNAITISMPSSVVEGSPVMTSISFENKSFSKAEMLLNGKQVASLVFVGSSTGVDYDSSKIAFANYKDPRFNLIFHGFKAGSFNIKVVTKDAGEKVLKSKEVSLTVFSPASTTVLEGVSKELNDFKKETISNIEAKTSTLQRELEKKILDSKSSLEDKIAPLEKTVSSLGESIKKSEGNITQLEKQANEISSLIQKSNSTVSGLEEKVSVLDKKLSEKSSRLEGVSSKLEEIEANLIEFKKSQENTPLAGFFNFVGGSPFVGAVLILIVLILIIAIFAYNKKSEDKPLFEESDGTAFSEEAHENEKNLSETINRVEQESIGKETSENKEKEYLASLKSKGKWAWKPEKEANKQKGFSLGDLIKKE